MASPQQPARKSRARRPPREPAAELPVARVAVEISLPNLDRPFDYLVPEPLAAVAVPGCRVRIRFAGRLAGGYLLERVAVSEHQGKLGYLERVVSPEPVLSADLTGLARAVADWYGGTLADVLRLAIPPRHAAAEASTASGQDPAAPQEHASLAEPAGSAWSLYPAGLSFLAALAAGRSPRAIWSALPGVSWPAQIAEAVAAAAAGGRGSVVVVPDARDLDRVDGALTGRLGPGRHVILSASLGQAERYRRWLAVARGEVEVVAGTRSAAFAPVRNLGLAVLWDECDDLHAEPRAPYPHAREILVLRAHRSHAGALVGGFARTAEAAQLLATGWAKALAADRAATRQAAPAVLAAGDDTELARDEGARSARLPSLALRTAREALAHGPVLVQVPRHGYLTAVACDQCRTQARCTCGGPAELPGPGAALRCGWCGSPVAGRCAHCGHEGLRALTTGAGRTAEELARAFRDVRVLSSGGDAVLPAVRADPAIVVATPGAEPVAPAGYSAALLLDGWALLGRPSLRAAEEALRRWMNAAALVRPAGAGGRVVVVADQGLPAVQALIRWDAATFADRELAARAQLRFPPAARMAAITGSEEAIKAFLADVAMPPGAELLGPVPAHEGAAGAEMVRYLLRVPRQAGRELAAALHVGQAVRAARKDQDQLRIQLDPAALV